MFDPGVLASVHTIVVHDDCSDGLASALLLHNALPRADVRFVQYATDGHRRLAAQPGILFCDLSPPRERAKEFRDSGAIVLDHHRSTRDVVADFGERGVFGDEESEPGVSGAVLAFRHVWLSLRKGDRLQPFAARFAELAGVRDTWQTGSAHWLEACVQHQALSSVPSDDWLKLSLSEIAEQWESRFSWLGRVVLGKQEEQIRRALAGAHRFRTRTGLRVIAFNGLPLVSDAAEMARDDADIVIGFLLEIGAEAPRMRVSVRSNGRVDASALAARFGGGGHLRAAGFTVGLTPAEPHPFVLLERLLDHT
jgi:oligoribonuclease NrnB/cAMP/cGMP phosphodiesterase (DHH superfamily)